LFVRSHFATPPQSFILSLDWSKAYDRVSHHWLDHVLEHISFPRPFRRLLHCTYHHRHSQLFINGHLGPSFPISKGVPQGDPVAPILFNLSIEPLFNALRSARLWVRAYADDTYAIGFDEHAWQPLHFWLAQYNLSAGGEVHWGKTTLIPLSPSSYTPPPNTPPPSSLPLSTLGVLLPLSRANIDSLWDSLLLKVSARIDSLHTRSLSLRGRILVAKSLVLSKIWYHVVVAPPSPTYVQQLNVLLRKLIWHSRNIHPASLTTSSLSLDEGGISYPDIQTEINIRTIKLTSVAFSPTSPPYWMKCANMVIQSRTNSSIPHLILTHRTTYLDYEPFRSGIKAASHLEHLAPTTILDSPSLPSLRAILRFSPPTPLTPYNPSPFLHPFSWSEIWHQHRPRKMADVLWKIGHQQLPTGTKVANYAKDGPYCPWCPGTVNSIAHLFHDCPTATLIWTLTIQVASLLTNSITPLDNLIHHPSLPHQRIGRTLQSVAIYTKWIAYTERAFSSLTPPLKTNSELSKALLTNILSQRKLDTQLHRAPWPPPSQIIHIFNPV